jgi:hypothetical protein
MTTVASEKITPKNNLASTVLKVNTIMVLTNRNVTKVDHDYCYTLLTNLLCRHAAPIEINPLNHIHL